MMNAAERFLLARKASFDPLSLSPAMWFKAEGVNNNVDGTSVALWNDSSGNGRTISQGTLAVRPTLKTNQINGKPVVRFNAAASEYVSNVFPMTLKQVVIVAKYTGGSSGNFPTNFPGLINHTDNTQPLVLTGNAAGNSNFYNESLVTVYHRDGVNYPEANMPAPIDVWGICSISAVAGWAVGTGYGMTMGQDRNNGAGRFWNGDIAEAFVFTSILSDTDRKKLEAYLSARFGIAVTP